MQEGVQSASIVAQSSDVCRPWWARDGVKSATKTAPASAEDVGAGSCVARALLVKLRAVHGLYLAKDSRSISIRRLIARI